MNGTRCKLGKKESYLKVVLNPAPVWKVDKNHVRNQL